MKKILSCIIFLMCTFIIYLKVEHIFLEKVLIPDSIRFYYEPKHSIDMIFFGTSYQHWGISPMELWDKYGLISYKRSSPFQGGIVMLKYIEEALLYQKPKVIYIDVATLYMSYLRDKDWVILNHMKFGFSKVLYFYELYKEDFLNKMNIINMFHFRWKNLQLNDFVQYSYTKGLSVDRWSFISYNQKRNIEYKNKSKVILSDAQMHLLEQILEIANKNNTKVVFVFPPMNRQNLIDYSIAFEEIAKEKKLDYINMNNHLKTINIVFSKDFWDPTHINIYGGRKQMNYVIPYIMKMYNIPNKKNDPAYASWNEDYIKYARAINQVELRQLKSFQEWQNLAYYDNYTMLISTNGDDVLNRLPQVMKDKFTTLGLTKFETDKKNQKYAAIIDNNQVFFEEVSDNKVEYKGRMKNKVNLLVSSEPNKATINVSGKSRSKNRYGINFVIYDKINREIVDSIWIDPAQPDVIRR